MEQIDGVATSATSGSGTQIQRVRDNRRVRQWASGLVVTIGVLTVVFALSRPLRGHFDAAMDLLPFEVLHIASGTALFTGFALVLTARGLRHGHRLAWLATEALLVSTVVLSLLRDAAIGAVALVLAVWLLASSRAFRVLPTRLQVQRAVVGAVAASAAVVATQAVLTLALPHEDEGRPTTHQWDRAGEVPLFTAHLPRTLMIELALAVVCTSVWLVISPRRRTHPTPEQHEADLARARGIVARHGGGTLDYFALREDKEWFFSGDSMVAFATRGSVCLVSPDPVGPAEEHFQVWADFLEFASDRGWNIAVVAAAADWLEVYEHSGLQSWYFGDEAVVDVAGFTLAGSANKGLRQAVNRVERAGVRCEMLHPDHADPDLQAQVMAMAEHSRQGRAERGFSMSLSRLFDPRDTELLLAVARTEDGRVLGFIQWVPAAALPGWSLDVMRRDTDAPDLPNGLTDFMIVRSLQFAAERGDRSMSLNFAVLRESLHRDRPGLSGLVRRRVLDAVARRSQMGALEMFNAKYDPRWVPRYLVGGSNDEVVAQAVAIAQAEGRLELGRARRTP